jgi:ankyrin repeat protein
MEEFCGEVGMIGRIFVSARKGDITAIESFLERGGDVNASDRVSEIILMTPTEERNEQVNYCTMLDHACSTGNIDIAKLLLDRGALIKQNKVSLCFVSIKSLNEPDIV